MDLQIVKKSDFSVKIECSTTLSKAYISQILSSYGKIHEIIAKDNYCSIISYQSKEAVQRCNNNKEYISMIIKDHVGNNLNCTGDKICNGRARKFSTVKSLFKHLTQFTSTNGSGGSNSSADSSNDILKKLSINTSKRKTSLSSDIFTPSCSSPVLLNTNKDSGFRLAYCHTVTNLKCDKQIEKLNCFNQSIKKYLDYTTPIGSQEILLTNLPADIVEEDIYKLCGNIEHVSVELKITSNINALYACIKVKTKEDFDKLTEMLCNIQINGIKITSIPITKIADSSEKLSTSD